MSDTIPHSQFDAQALDLLMPMSISILPSGLIGRAGVTIAKMRPDEGLIGKPFLDLFEITRPRRDFTGYSDLQSVVGSKLRMQFRGGAPIVMKGVLVQEMRSGQLLVNLSFGYHLIDAVRQYGLSNGDFSQTDLAIEMLYLVEAKTAVMEETRKLTQRLHSARLVAEELASTDVLTGLKNRRAMDQALAGLANSQMPFGLMHIDLDYFKNVNDTHGHAAGDHVLQAAAKILTDETRKGDTVARVGGDEFVLIFEDLVDGEQLTEIAGRIVQRLEIPVQFDGKTCRISGSIGFTTSIFYDTPDLDQMLFDADLALYASKRNGRACTTMVTEQFLADAQGARQIPDRGQLSC